MRRKNQPFHDALICVVDDDAPVRHAIENLLESAGLTAVGFDSAEPCLTSPRRAHLAFAILDIQLGGMNGFDVQLQLQAGGPLPLVLLSAHGDQHAQRRALEAGAIALLRKARRRRTPAHPHRRRPGGGGDAPH